MWTAEKFLYDTAPDQAASYIIFNNSGDEFEDGRNMV